MEGGYGLISCIPIVVLLVSVLWTKRIFECIIVAIAIALFIGEGFSGMLWAFIDLIYVMLADETYSWILLMLLFGGLIKLLEESGGTFGFGAVATKYIKSDKSSLLATYILGILIFIDDYLNNLTIGSAMRGITDRYKVPREMLAITINTTGAPICVLNPFSTWAVFIFGLMQAAGVTGDQTLVVGYTKLIPYIWYAIVAVLMVPLMIYGVIPRVGPLKKAYQRVEEKGLLFPEELAESSAELDEARERILSKVDPKLRNFLIPMLVVVAVTLVTEDLVPGVILGILTCFIMYIPAKVMTIKEFIENFFEGMKDMIFIATFIMMAFIFVEIENGLGFSDYVIETVKPYMIGGLIPVITFIVVGLMSFAGMDFWAVMILFFPIVVPLSEHFGINLYLAMGSIVSGATFGGHACFFSDQMLMSSASVQIRATDEAVALLPYAVMAAVVTAVLYLIFGFVI